MKKYSVFIVENSDGERICELWESFDRLTEAILAKEKLDSGWGGKSLIWETYE